MKERFKISKLIIVEGKYDKIKLENLVDGLIVTTDGFGIFKNKEKAAFFKEYAHRNGAVIITDSDSAGFLIRKRLNDILPHDRVTNIFLPEIYGKEKRKSSPSKEGKLGLEGLPDSVILQALKQGDTLASTKPESACEITAYTLYELGLSGTKNSRSRLNKLLSYLSLPKGISKKSLLKVLNNSYTLLKFRDIVGKICK